MPKQIKIIFCDVDWTIYDHSNGKHVLDFASIEALNKMHDLGVKIAICTARSYNSLFYINILDYLKADAVIASNGYIITVGNDVIYRYEIEQDKYLAICDLCFKNNINLEIVEDFHCSLLKEVDQKVKDYYAIYDEEMPNVEIDYKNKKPVSLLLFSSEEDDKNIIPFMPQGIKYYRFFPTGVDLTSLDNPKDKGQAVRKVLDYYHFKKEDAISFGDDYGDIPMFIETGISYVLSNAPIEVKNKANVVIDNVSNHGVKQALEKYYLK